MTQTTAPPASATTSGSASAKTESSTDVPRKKDLTGSWKLNKEESTQPRKRNDENSGGGGRHGGGYPGGGGGGWPGGGHGGYGGGGMHRGGMSDQERSEMQELMRPSETLDFTQDGPAIKMIDDYERHRTFYTDGRKVKKSKDADNQEFDATWNEYRLVSDFKDPDGNKVERSFEVMEGNQQLRETIHFTMGRSQREVYLRYVYDLVSSQNSGAK
ncbi:MAG TPA: hypothetical protein VEU98_03800 [Candidatus Eremiobacteraceae bacterium]|nr:hypothetical protein [Candidatus Eremiobacteraceae bacterium]